MQREYTINFLGEGTFGCTICPPIKLTDEFIKKKPDFSIKNFSFDKIDNCNYIGKILAVNRPGKTNDTYESELKNLLLIQELDPDGIYTPQLIYANIHKASDLLNKIKNNTKLSACLNDKIKKENKYGYIILKHVGVNLQKKYETYNNNLKKLDNSMSIILFLRKFIKLLNFLDKIYEKYIHLDIKSDNITETDANEMFLIDFGRFQEINKINVIHFVTKLLKQEHYMVSFEPKIYNKLLSKKNKIKNLTINQLIDYIDNNFEELISPYIFNNSVKQIFQKIFYSDWEKQLKQGEFIIFRDKKYNISYIYDYIRYRQKQYFINYLEIKYSENIYDKIYNIDNFLYNMFLPIINKIDFSYIGITFARTIIYFNYDTYDKCSVHFKKHFEKIIKDLLFNKFDDVKTFINDLEYLINYELLINLINKRFS